MTQLAREGMPKDVHHILVDTPALAGGFVLWLVVTEEAMKLAGRYSSANWDVRELVHAIKGGALDDELTLKMRPL